MSGEFLRAVEALSDPGDVIELRALKNGATAAGYFDDLGALSTNAAKFDEQGYTTYVTLNPVEPALLARAENKVRRSLRETTSDKDVLRRRRLLVDADPVLPAGISSTDDEKRAALWRVREVYAHLKERGWPEPVVGDSGNGAHLLYFVDLPNDAESLELVKGVLEALSFKFSDGQVKVDASVSNAARISKLYGTTARKGDSTKDRPHRASKLLKVPEQRAEVSREQLQAVAATKPEQPKPARGKPRSGFGEYPEFDLAEWITEHGVLVKREGPWQQGYRYILEECPWNGHTDNACYVLQFPSGAVFAGCQHDSCRTGENRWRELRKHYEPGAYEYGRHERNGCQTGSESLSRATEGPYGAHGVLLSEVKPERVAWLWSGRIPRGKITLIDGDPGLGKSAVTIDLAARVSAGRPWPDGPEASPEAGGVVILSAEDGLADTIRPRFDAAGGDPSKAVALSTVPDAEGNERQLSLPEDLGVIEAAIERVGAVLVVVDPLMAFLSGETNSHRDQDVRRALAPLARLAERTGAAVGVVRHLNKATGGAAIYRGGGSIGIVGAARSGLLIAKHPEDDGRRVMASIKSNLAAPAPSLVFGLEEADNGAVRVSWKGESTLDASALLSAPTDHEERSAAQDAQDFLRAVLSCGPKTAAAVREQADKAGLSWRTVERAKASLGVRSTRQGEVGKQGGGQWVWELPADLGRHPSGAAALTAGTGEEDEKTAYLSKKQGEGLSPPPLSPPGAASNSGGLDQPLSAEDVAAETRRAQSGPALALATYLQEPSEKRLEWLTKAVLAIRGVDTKDWHRHAGAVEEAALDPTSHPLDCPGEECA